MFKRRMVIVSILVGLLFGFPHIIGLIQNHPYVSTVVVNVQPYSFDENHYAVRINKFLNGNFFADAYTFEYRLGPFIFSSASTFFLSLLAKTVGNVQNLFIIADFIFPPILFLIFYLLFRLFVNQYLAAVGSLYIILEDQIYGYLKPLLFTLKSFSIEPLVQHLGNIVSPPFYSRLENPELTGIFFFLGLWVLLSLFTDKNISYKKYFILFTSIIFLVYSYFFYSIFLILLVIIYLGYLICFKDKKRNKFTLFTLLLALGSLPYIIQLYKFFKLPQAIDFSIRAGYKSFPFYIPPSAIITLICLLSVAYFKKNKTKERLLGGLLILVFFCIFLFPVQADHYISRVLVPILRLSQFYLIYLVLRYLFKFKIKGSLSLYFRAGIILILIFAYIHAFFYTRNNIKYFTLSPEKLQAYDWLKNNTKWDDVVLSYSIQTNFQAPAFANIYMLLPYTAFSFIPTSEVSERLWLSYKCINAEQVLSQIVGLSIDSKSTWHPDENEIETKGGFIYYVKKGTTKKGIGISADEIKKNDLQYAELKCSRVSDIRSYGYKVDYLIWGLYEKNHYQLPSEGLEKKYENPEVTIYKII